MSWLQLRVYSKHPEFAEEILLAHGAQAVSMADAADDPLFEPRPGETPLWRSTATIGLFAESTDLAPVQGALRELLPDGDRARTSSELLEDQDWVRVWLESWQPMKFGRRLWVTPLEKLGEIHDAGAVIMKLDPGLAFGTGTHPTTALCLEWLDGRDLNGKTVLDYGCGSGILAIAALLLGAERALCVDIDPQALLAAKQNAEANGVGARLKAMPPEAFIPFPADVVLANILANPLVQLAPLLSSSVKQQGQIALAGLTTAQAEEVRAAYAPWFSLDADAVKEGWSRISGRCFMPAMIAYKKISDRIGSAGQPRAEHFPALAQGGYEAVINLALADSPNALADESRLCAQSGLRYVHIPVQWTNPTAKDFSEFCTAMEALEDRKVLVHCAMNKRVSAFLYLYRVLRLGENLETAAADLRQIWEPDKNWASFIEQTLRQKFQK